MQVLARLRSKRIRGPAAPKCGGASSLLHPALAEQTDRPRQTHVVAAGQLIEILERDLLVGRVLDTNLQTERPKLVDEDLERLRNARLRQGLALNDALVSPNASHDVVRLDREQLLERV